MAKAMLWAFWIGLTVCSLFSGAVLGLRAVGFFDEPKRQLCDDDHGHGTHVLEDSATALTGTSTQHLDSAATFTFDSAPQRGCYRVVEEIPDADWICTEGCAYVDGQACCELPDGSVECWR